MFVIKDKVIHLTRGDIATIEVAVKNSDETDYVFNPGDVVRLRVMKSGKCDHIEIQKDVTVTKRATSVNINLTSADTKIGDYIHKPVTYWYEIELNPDTNPQTIIGYDEKGAKTFILYPEGGNKE